MTDLVSPPLDASLEAMLAPVPGPDPCGASLRGDALFTDIRLAREEDDPNLPMRQWERALKKADWPLIETLCTDMLTTRSKDLQLAAWLTEAWTRQPAGLAGLARGLLLMRELVERHWEGLYPRIDPPEEGGDCEARVAPFEWLSENMANTVRVRVCLFPLAQRKPASVSLADWERLTASELSPNAEPPPPTDPADPEPLTRDEIIANVARHAPEVVDVRLADVRESMAHLVALGGALDALLGPQAPNLRKLAAVLEGLERVLLQVRAALPARAGPQATPPPVPSQDDPLADTRLDDTASGAAALSGAAGEPQAPVANGAWRNRDEAYRTLEALAAYLMAIEPHSPTPYLIRRAVNWGRLPLPELMAEIMQEEGDLNRLVQLLGLNR